MQNLNSQVVLALILAALAGGVIGWWLRGLSGRKGTSAPHPEHAVVGGTLPGEAGRTQSVAVDTGTAAGHPIEDIESIGKGFGARLRAMDISTVEQLLTKCQTDDAQVAIARQMDLEEFVVHKWVCIADLMRVPGVGSQFAELLEASGVQSVQELSEQNPRALVVSMKEANVSEARTRPVPNLDTVVSWIDKAKSLPPVI